MVLAGHLHVTQAQDFFVRETFNGHVRRGLINPAPKTSSTRRCVLAATAQALRTTWSGSSRVTTSPMVTPLSVKPDALSNRLFLVGSHAKYIIQKGRIGNSHALLHPQVSAPRNPARCHGGARRPHLLLRPHDGGDESFGDDLRADHALSTLKLEMSQVIEASFRQVPPRMERDRGVPSVRPPSMPASTQPTPPTWLSAGRRHAARHQL